MSKASRQKYGPPGATVRDATPEELAKLTVADVVIRAPVRFSGDGDLAGPPPAPDPLLAALRDLTRVMAVETLRQMHHCSRCDRPSRWSSGFTGSLLCQAHKEAQEAQGHGSFTAVPESVMAERLYAFVMGET